MRFNEFCFEDSDTFSTLKNAARREKYARYDANGNIDINGQFDYRGKPYTPDPILEQMKTAVREYCHKFCKANPQCHYLNKVDEWDVAMLRDKDIVYFVTHNSRYSLYPDKFFARSRINPRAYVKGTIKAVGKDRYIINMYETNLLKRPTWTPLGIIYDEDTAQYIRDPSMPKNAPSNNPKNAPANNPTAPANNPKNAPVPTTEEEWNDSILLPEDAAIQSDTWDGPFTPPEGSVIFKDWVWDANEQ